MRAGVEVLDLASCRLRAMGTDVHILVVDGDDVDLHWADAEVERLEALWSRFRDDSEVSRINHHAGAWVEVAPETVSVLRLAIEAWHDTAGAFDPLLGSQLVALGYDRSFEQVDRSGAGAICPPPTPALRHPDDIELDPGRGRARIAADRALDLGGLAKGWAADHLVAGLLDRGAAGACANLGGDLAVAGRAPHGDGWHIGVDHEASTVPHGVLAVPTGGVATSTTLRRRWSGPGGDDRHHLLDPRGGTSCRGALVEVTAVAATASRAEILTKVAFVSREHLDRAVGAGEAVLLTTADGLTRSLGDLARLTPVTSGAPDAG